MFWVYSSQCWGIARRSNTLPADPSYRPHLVLCRYANIRNNTGLTAVHYAVRAGAAQVLQVLLCGGANPLLTSFINCMWEGLPRGSSPLHLAARKNDNALALQLLRAYVSAVLWPDPSRVANSLRSAPWFVDVHVSAAASMLFSFSSYICFLCEHS